MFLVTPDTVLNPGALHTRELPRRILGYVTLWPAGGGWRLWGRVLFELEVLRYSATLLPFAGAALIWRDNALAIAQAPLPMFMAVYLAEMRLLRLTPEARERLADPVAEARGLDLLAARGRDLLARIAAGRGMDDGALRLVVEQSDMARVAPLTLVSVQAEETRGTGPHVMRLTADEARLVRDRLFAPPLTERDLHRINLAQNAMLREVRLEAAEVSAHARLEALMAAAQ